MSFPIKANLLFSKYACVAIAPLFFPWFTKRMWVLQFSVIEWSMELNLQVFSNREVTLQIKIPHDCLLTCNIDVLNVFVIDAEGIIIGVQLHASPGDEAKTVFTLRELVRFVNKMCRN